MDREYRRKMARLLLEKLPVLDVSWPQHLQNQWWAWLIRFHQELAP